MGIKEWSLEKYMKADDDKMCGYNERSLKEQKEKTSITLVLCDKDDEGFDGWRCSCWVKKKLNNEKMHIVNYQQKSTPELVKILGEENKEDAHIQAKMKKAKDVKKMNE